MPGKGEVEPYGEIVVGELVPDRPVPSAPQTSARMAEAVPSLPPTDRLEGMKAAGAVSYQEERTKLAQAAADKAKADATVHVSDTWRKEIRSRNVPIALIFLVAAAAIAALAASTVAIVRLASPTLTLPTIGASLLSFCTIAGIAIGSIRSIYISSTTVARK
jgi:hypothetical protein